MSTGIFTLGDLAITGAATYVGPWVTGLDAEKVFTPQLRLLYGSGGTSGVAYVQTSLDQGITAIDVYAMSFTTANKSGVVSLSAGSMTTPYTPTDGGLASDTVKDGILGDRLRLKIVTLGTYAGSTVLSGRVSAK